MVKIDPRVQSYEDADRATWYLLAEGSLSNGYEAVNGTAFRFENNVWITCAHCVGSLLLKEVLPQIRLSRREPGVPTIFVRVVDVDWHRDIAVLRPLPMEPVPKSLAYFCRARQLPEREDQVGLMGFPSSIEHHPPVFMRARVVRKRPVSGVLRIEVDKLIIKGNSGGPLFDKNYHVVGVVVEGAGADMNAAVAITELKGLRFK